MKDRERLCIINVIMQMYDKVRLNVYELIYLNINELFVVAAAT